LIVGVPKETFPGERRVALVPPVLPTLAKADIQVLLEPGAGAAAGFPDSAYEEKGGKIALSRADLFGSAGLILQVRALGANPVAGRADTSLYRAGQAVIALCRPLSSPEAVRELAESGVTVFSLELLPRITRAQSMDVLSSMSTVAGYKAVLLAARRLGAVVEAYDVRAAVKEQVESLGAKFVELPLPGESVEGEGGYAKALDEEFYRRQRETMSRVVAESDVVITTGRWWPAWGPDR
jgi:NAD(P) transhydrogenase subunit alpha